MKRLISMILTAAMLLSMLPAPVFAEGAEEDIPAAEAEYELPEEVQEPAETEQPEETEEAVPEETEAALQPDEYEPVYYCGDTVTWKYDDTGVLTISGTGAMYDYSKSNYPWRYLFRNIRRIVVEPGVTAIGTYAFYECYAQSVSLPATLEAIGTGAFDLSSISELTIEEGNAHFTAVDNVMYSADMETLLWCPAGREGELEIPEGVHSIVERAFSGNRSLTKVTIPESVTSIGEYAFFNCTGLTSLTLNASVSQLERYTFYGCTGLRDVELPEGMTATGSYAFGRCSSLYSVTLPRSLQEISDGTFTECTSLEICNMPENLTTIGERAFTSCSALHAVRIPGTVQKIGRYAYTGCGGLKSVTMEEGVTTISAYAFRECTKLETVTVPGSATLYEASIFEGCSSLKNVNLGEGIPSLGSHCFKDCTSLESIALPDSMNVDGTAFLGCSSLMGFMVSDSNPRYASVDGVLYDQNIEKLVIVPGGNTGNGSYTGKFVVPGSVRYINNWAFTHCDKLTDVILPDDLTLLASGVFEYCSNLRSVAIPEKITKIWTNTFDSCEALTYVGIPEAVTQIDSNAFRNCSGLTDVYYAGTESQWNAITVASGNEALQNAEVHYESTMPTANLSQGTCGEDLRWRLDEYGTLTIFGFGTMYDYSQDDPAPWMEYADVIREIRFSNIDMIDNVGDYAFANCTRAEIIRITDGVQTIGQYAFLNCTSAKSFVIDKYIGQRLKTIKEGAFENCRQLKSFKIPSTAQVIEERAFAGCSQLTDLTVNEKSETFFVENGILYQGVRDYGVLQNGDKMYFWNQVDMRLCLPAETGTVSFSQSISRLPPYAFYNCSGLTGIIFPPDVTVLPHNVLEGCTGLTSLSIPEGITAIGKEAFKDCTAMSYVDIPVSMEAIKETAFDGCGNLRDIYYYGSETQWKEIDGFDTVPENVKIHYNIGNQVADITVKVFCDSNTAEPDFVLRFDRKTGSYLTATDVLRAADCATDRLIIGFALEEIQNPGSRFDKYLVTSQAEQTIAARAALASKDTIYSGFKFNRDAFAFDNTGSESPGDGNSSGFYSGPPIKLLPEDEKWIKETFGSKKKEVESVRKQEEAFMGACFGMVVVMGLAFVDHLDLSDYGGRYPAEVPFPYENPKLESLLARYFYSQMIYKGEVNEFEYRENRKGLVEHFESTAEPVAVGYSLDKNGHEVLAIGMDAVSNPDYYIIYTADPDCLSSGLPKQILISKRDYSCHIPDGVVSDYRFYYIEMSRFAKELPPSAFNTFVTNAGFCSIQFGKETAEIIDGEAYGSGEIDGPDYFSYGSTTSSRAIWKLKTAETCTVTFRDGNADTYGWMAFGGSDVLFESVEGCTGTVVYGSDGSVELRNFTTPSVIQTTQADGKSPFYEITADCENLLVTPVGGIVMISSDAPLGDLSITVDEETTEFTAEGSEILFAPASADTPAAVIDPAVLRQAMASGRSYLILAEGSTAELIEGVDSVQIAGGVQFSVDNGEVVSVDGCGRVTALSAGTAFVTMSAAVGKETISSRCRIDVVAGEEEHPIAEQIPVNGAKLVETKASVELFQTNYTRVGVLLSLPQNMMVSTAGEAPADQGAALEGAEFADAAAAQWFRLRVVDDRYLEIIPSAEAMKNPKAVKSSYKTAVHVIVDGSLFTTDTLTLNVKKTMPKVKADTVKINSYAALPVQISFTGGKVTALEPAEPLPAAFALDGMLVSYIGTAPKANARLKLLAQVEGWAVPQAITVAVSVARTEPVVTLSAKSVSLLSGTNDTARIGVSVSGNADLVWILTDSKGNPSSAFLYAYDNGVLTVRAKPDTPAGVSAKLTVSAAGAAKKTVMTLKTASAKVKPALNLKITGAIDMALPGSTVMVMANVSDFHVGSGEAWHVTVVKTGGKPAVSVDVTDSFRIMRGMGSFLLMAANLEKDYTYTACVALDIDHDGVSDCEKTVKLPVKWSDPAKVPASVTIKASGSIDVIRPGTSVTITPVPKNVYGFAPEPSNLRFYANKVLLENAPFTVVMENGKYVITENGADPGVKYSVDFCAEIGGKTVTSKAVPISVKMGPAKVNQSLKSVTLLKNDRYDTAYFSLSPAGEDLAPIARIEQDDASAAAYTVEALEDGRYLIHFTDYRAAAKAGTVKLAVYLKGNRTAKPNAIISLKVMLK